MGLVLLAASLSLVVGTWDAAVTRTLLLAALVVAPAIAGTSASLIRGLWEQVAGSVRERPRYVWLMAALGCAAGAVAGLLYVVAQLSAIAPVADGQLSPLTGRLVPFALLTGFLTGFAADAFFRRMAERAIDPIRVPAVSMPPAASSPSSSAASRDCPVAHMRSSTVSSSSPALPSSERMVSSVSPCARSAADNCLRMRV